MGTLGMPEWRTYKNDEILVCIYKLCVFITSPEALNRIKSSVSEDNNNGGKSKCLRHTLD